MNPLLTANDLARWADSIGARATLPLLVRRLIRASVDPAHIHLPAGDSVGRPGYDGLVRAAATGPHVPDGQSAWEMGTNRDIARKANEDYRGRTEAPGLVAPADTAFVFVTPRRWDGKDQWAADRRAEGVWADVRCIDADDLEDWLECCPAVAAWARGEIVGLPQGIRTFEEVWRAWSARTNPRLTPALFTAGRQHEADRVRAWLAGPPSCLRIVADRGTADEGAGFLAAVVEASDDIRERIHARGVFVETAPIWRHVAGGRTPCVVATTSPDIAADVAGAVRRGHHVALLSGQEQGGVHDGVGLGPLRQRHLESALLDMGVGRERSRELSHESRGSIAAVVDLLDGEARPPRWADPAVGARLVPLLLAGSWRDASPDVEAVARLARTTAEEVGRCLAQWSHEADPPVRLVGGVWEWVSRQRGWRRLARYVTQADLVALRQVAVEVFGEADPQLELEPDQRWAAAVYNRPWQYSGHLRRGLAEGLAILGARDGGVSAAARPDDVAARVVHDLLGQAADPGRWHALADILPWLAEAAPDAFLAAVERGPVADEAVWACLSEREGLGQLGRRHHLMWALESLAWSPQYLPRVTLILGSLAANGPDADRGNGPLGSLQHIFLGWHPGTAATVTQRLAALNAFYRVRPSVAFGLCAWLALTSHTTATPTSRPRHRRWAGDGERRATVGEYHEFLRRLFEQLMAWVGHDQARWATMLSPFRYTTPEQLSPFFDRLESLPLEEMADEPDGELRRTVRRVLHHKRTNERAYPELTEEHVARLEAAYERLAPADPVRRDAWLFANNPDLLSVSGSDWQAEEEAANRERAEAVQRFLDSGRAGELPRLAGAVERPWSVGYYAGQSRLPDEALSGLLNGRLEPGRTMWDRFDGGLVWGRFRRDGWPWVERTFASDAARAWSVDRQAQFATALPFEAPTWDWIEARGAEAAAAYWHAANGAPIDPRRDATRAVRALLDHRRPSDALRLAHLSNWHPEFRGVVPPELMLEVVQALTAAALGDAPADEPDRIERDVSGSLGDALAAIEAAGVADARELVRIEWAWFDVLEQDIRGPAVIYRTLQNEPAFFVDLIRNAFLPRLPEGVEPPAVPSNLARRSGWVLMHWAGTPGSQQDGTFDPAALRCWVDAARTLLRESGHEGIGDQQIGQVAARVPEGADGVWPHQCLRDMLEEFASEDIESGVYLGVVNGRGVTVREMGAGGEQEQTLVARYEAAAEALYAWPRTATLLRVIAERYRRDADWQDDRRDLNEFAR